MSSILSIVSGIGIAAIILFLFANVTSPDEGAGYVYLAVSLGSCFLIVVYRVLLRGSFFFERHAVMLLSFLTYFLFKILLDVPDISEMKAFTVGTSGGVLFSIVLGIQVSILASEMLTRDKSGTRRLMLCALFLLLAIVLSLDAFGTHLQSIRSDLFLIDSEVRRYQRPGNFCVMAIVTLSVIVVYAGGPGKRILARLLGIANLIAFALLTVTLLLITQLIGSNLGFVTVFCVAFSTSVWKIGRESNFAKWRSLVNHKRNSALSKLRMLMPRYIWWVGVFGGLTAAITLLVFALTPIEPQSFRIFGFDEGSLGGDSLQNRLRMLSNNFLQQWAYNPFLGNLRADELTTGEGTYAHSIISVFSHLGIVGGILLLAYLVSLYENLARARLNAKVFYDDVDAGVFRIVLLSTILGISAIATFFTWMPLWYTLGLLFPPIVVHSTKYHKLANFSIRATENVLSAKS